MFDKLTAKKRAINNWQRLRIVLLLLQVCGGRTTEAKKKLVKIDAQKQKTCKARIAKKIIDPKSRWKIIWDIIVAIFYLTTLVTDPVVLSFHF